ncbi:RelA/SpoT domain-containing protein [Pontibacter sp. BT310]|jgi:putative GTP pyrophosphokinase|uniref:RelA/SpoT domain-containing protein n=1 Tax=Pontibacter populi TaxID=890055 RepID=A0ABS6XFF2_9BACT|nr:MULTISPECIES: RelA/SpoT domain-containing protein [Pontibacter]MBJ6119847.1 RelA/SpoT domain-containing protein [Pontibacter sp. BT310]MBR0572276.1 RelA/SpoT domain-containing protein [Microvirga sp. STS03]MBW3366700.1 RelA/SpoT domain-containing protein [Pontibacter populi]
MSRLYTNNEVKLAGKILTEPQKYSLDELDFAQTVLTYWRTIHASPINTFQATLRDKINRLDYYDALIAQRLKRAVSIVAKLDRFPNMKLSTMQDIAGLRAIVKNVDQVRTLEKNYRESNFKHLLKDDKDYILDPAPSGYRGIHLIYQYVNEKNHESNGLRVELQIRTKLQHTWATAVETMGTFLKYSLKSSQGPVNWLDYFSLVSAGFAILEKCPTSENYKDLAPKDIFQKIVDESKKLNVSEKLRAFTVAADHIFQSQANSKYNLITLNLEKRVVNVKSYSARQLRRANIDYTNIEKEINKGAPIQAVLVSTGSIDSLRKAYPSYFLDTQEFLSKLNMIYHRLQKIK